MKNKQKILINQKVGQCVIEFSAQRLKIAKAQFRLNKPVVVYLDVFDNPGGSDQEFIKFLERVLKQKNIKKDNFILALDRSLVTIRFVNLPSTDLKEIESMAHWQAAKLFPYQSDQIVTSYSILEVNPEGFSHLLLVIVPRLIIKRYLDICQVLKLQPHCITITSEGLLYWYLLKQPQLQVLQPTAVIDIENKRLELAVLNKSDFIFSRSVDLDGVWQQPMLQKVIDEIMLSLDSYQKQPIYMNLSKIILTGNRNNINALEPLLKNKIDTPVQVIEHLQQVELHKSLTNSSALSNSSFSSIVGLVLNTTSEHKINLLPKELKERRLFLKKKREFLNSLVFIGLAVLILLMMFGIYIYSKIMLIQQLDEKLKKINPKATEVEELKKRLNIINSHIQQKASCLDILRELHLITPNDVFLSTFIYEDGQAVTIKGTAPSMSVVFSFVPILNKSDFFENVSVRYATQRKTTGSELTDFEIVCPLEKK